MALSNKVHLSVTGEAGEALSHGCVDPELAKPGTELVVEWGDHGRRIKKARVTVERFPYLTEKRNSD